MFLLWDYQAYLIWFWIFCSSFPSLSLYSIFKWFICIIYCFWHAAPGKQESDLHFALSTLTPTLTSITLTLSSILLLRDAEKEGEHEASYYKMLHMSRVWESSSFKAVINLFSSDVKWEQKLSVLLRIKLTHTIGVIFKRRTGREERKK